MNIDELYNEIERDLKIDDTELDLESIRTPQLHNKYLKLYTTHSLQLKHYPMPDLDRLHDFVSALIMHSLMYHPQQS